jgi:LysM repeat protein
MLRSAITALALATLAVAAPAQAQSPCGATVKVERGDTLSRIAERCDLTERSLLRLNPRIEASRDLRVGMDIAVRGTGGSGANALDRFGSIAGEAADALSGFARELGSEAQELVEKNPDLRQRLEGLGQRLRDSIGSSDSRPQQGATISISRREAAVGETVEVTARGLPQNAQVVLGAGAPQAAYDVVQTARTGSDGTLRAAVRVPDWAGDMRRVVLVVAAEDGSWSVRSGPVQVTGTRL